VSKSASSTDERSNSNSCCDVDEFEEWMKLVSKLSSIVSISAGRKACQIQN